MLGALEARDLRAYYVWLPILPTDTEAAAETASAAFNDPRASHYWDADLALARHLAAALGITAEHASIGTQVGVAWDVYLAYGRSEKAIEQPDFWMHQLRVPHAPRLDADAWRERVEGMLAEGGA